MRSTARLVVVGVTVLLAACTAPAGALPSSAPPSSAPPSSAPSATPAAPSSSSAAQGPWLRAWFTQALPPLNVFALSDMLVITADGVAVAGAPVPAIYPGPAVMPLNGRQLTPAGQAKLLARAQALGLLSGATDFGAASMPGAATAHIAFTVAGRPLEVTGNAEAGIECIKAPCDPAPGTPEAFGTFWRELTALDWLGADVAAETPYTPPVYSVLVGAAPAPAGNVGTTVAVWPLATPITSFGQPVANGTARCGTVTGADADLLRSALSKANSATQWVASPTTSATFGLTVRPLVAGQDACREVFGVG